MSKTNKPTQGGKRPGAGKPPKDPEQGARVKVSITLSKKHHQMTAGNRSDIIEKALIGFFIFRNFPSLHRYINQSKISQANLTGLTQNTKKNLIQFNMENSLIIDQSTARNAFLLSRAYSHPTRIKMMEKLAEHGSLCVSDFYEMPDCVLAIGERLEQSITSQHLRILREARLVEAERHGKFIYYRLAYSIATVNQNLTALATYYEKAAA